MEDLTVLASLAAIKLEQTGKGTTCESPPISSSLTRGRYVGVHGEGVRTNGEAQREFGGRWVHADEQDLVALAADCVWSLARHDHDQLGQSVGARKSGLMYNFNYCRGPPAKGVTELC